jgi:hypothetical protein
MFTCGPVLWDAWGVEVRTQPFRSGSEVASWPREVVLEFAGGGDGKLDVASEILAGDVVRMWKNVGRLVTDSELHGALRVATIGGDRQMAGADVQMVLADVELIVADPRM